MTEDARFEDGGESPLRLKAEEPADVEVLAALVQDAVFPATEMTWQAKNRRFALLLNRFRWEDQQTAARSGRAVERVQSVLAFDDVSGVQSQGVTRGDSDTILSLLTLTFEPGDDGAGRMVMTLAGDGGIALAVEAVNVTLQDVTRPYIAPSRKTPEHPE